MNWTAPKIKALKGQQNITALTAYDTLTAHYADEAGIPLILVGDSLAMTVLGYETTLPVSMDEMVHHTAAVSRGVKKGLVVADMPFMSYQGCMDKAVENAGRFIQQGADAVKIEGGALRAELIERLVANGIPVLGHIGLTPQSVKEFGGFKMQGKTNDAARALMDDAMVLEQAGVFAIVLECVPHSLAEMITSALSIPTIGIGAGPQCDGQILVFTDLLGMGHGRVPSFVKKYVDLKPQIQAAISSYKDEVESGAFPEG